MSRDMKKKFKKSSNIKAMATRMTFNSAPVVFCKSGFNFLAHAMRTKVQAFYGSGLIHNYFVSRNLGRINGLFVIPVEISQPCVKGGC